MALYKEFTDILGFENLKIKSFVLSLPIVESNKNGKETYRIFFCHIIGYLLCILGQYLNDARIFLVTLIL